jgi:hypothetical protein
LHEENVGNVMVCEKFAKNKGKLWGNVVWRNFGKQKSREKGLGANFLPSFSQVIAFCYPLSSKYCLFACSVCFISVIITRTAEYATSLPRVLSLVLFVGMAGGFESDQRVYFLVFFFCGEYAHYVRNMHIMHL